METTLLLIRSDMVTIIPRLSISWSVLCNSKQNAPTLYLRNFGASSDKPMSPKQHIKLKCQASWNVRQVKMSGNSRTAIIHQEVSWWPNLLGPMDLILMYQMSHLRTAWMYSWDFIAPTVKTLHQSCNGTSYYTLTALTQLFRHMLHVSDDIHLVKNSYCDAPCV